MLPTFILVAYLVCQGEDAIHGQQKDSLVVQALEYDFWVVLLKLYVIMQCLFTSEVKNDLGGQNCAILLKIFDKAIL